MLKCCIVCVCAHEFLWCVQLVLLCLFARVSVCLCWPVVQLHSHCWLPLLYPSVFCVTSKHLIISSSVIGILTVFLLLLTDSVCSHSLPPFVSCFLILFSLSSAAGTVLGNKFRGGQEKKAVHFMNSKSVS